MSLPTFLVIGAARAGSTWLHHLLDSHPDVYVPGRRKEIAYFDKLYTAKTRDCYGKFFV